MRRILALATGVAVATTLGITSAGAQGDSTKQFCDAAWKVNQFFNTLPDEPTEAQITKLEAKLDPLLADAGASAPPEIEPQVTAAAAIFRQGLETAFEDPNLEQYGQEIDTWTADNCGYQEVDATATEYEFSGIPKKLKPGRTAFRLTNDGAEIHEIAVVRIKTNTPLKKLLANEKRAQRETEFAGATFVEQDQTSVALVGLKKGRYAAVCFIPVGSTDPNTEVEGPPHAAEGMVQEFRVA